MRFESKAGGMQLVIAARDRLGLFSETAGLLSAHAVSVRSAVVHTVEGVAVNTWRVDKQLAADLPDAAFLVQQMERLEAGDPVGPAGGAAARGPGPGRPTRAAVRGGDP